MNLNDTLKLLETLKDCMTSIEIDSCNHDCSNCPNSLKITSIRDAYDSAIMVIKQILEDRPLVVYKGLAIRITQGHIDALVKYEQDEMLKETVNHIMNSFDEAINHPILNNEQMRMMAGLPPLENGIVRLKEDDNETPE